jgi:hypothetical protein
LGLKETTRPGDAHDRTCSTRICVENKKGRQIFWRPFQLRSSLGRLFDERVGRSRNRVRHVVIVGLHWDHL